MTEFLRWDDKNFPNIIELVVSLPSFWTVPT